MKKIILIATILFVVSCKNDDPYSEGMHWDYSITCENGFIYKSISDRGTIQILNSDGTPLRCGKKIY